MKLVSWLAKLLVDVQGAPAAPHVHGLPARPVKVSRVHCGRGPRLLMAGNRGAGGDAKVDKNAPARAKELKDIIAGQVGVPRLRTLMGPLTRRHYLPLPVLSSNRRKGKGRTH